MNLNRLAKAICALEGGKSELTIAQVKEVLKCEWLFMSQLKAKDLMDVIGNQLKASEKHRKWMK